MSDTSEFSTVSQFTTTSTLVADDDPARLFRAFVADINFRPPKKGMDPWKFKRPLVSEVIHGDRSIAIMGNTSPQVRWIHLPANCMVWVEVCLRLPPKLQALIEAGLDEKVEQREQGAHCSEYSHRLRAAREIEVCQYTEGRSLEECLPWKAFQRRPFAIHDTVRH
jgi:hypothetical protein